MKVLTLKQPHATLVVLNAKRIETRSWNTNYRGTILIHAGKAKSPEYRQLANKHQFHRYLDSGAQLPFEPFDLLPFGAIIGMADIIDSVPTERISKAETVPSWDAVVHSGGHTWTITPDEISFGDYGPGRYAWLLANIVKFERPIPARGMLSLWDYEPISDGIQEPISKNKHSQPFNLFT